MLPSRTAKVPWYKPHNSAALLAKMMKPTKTERAKARRSDVFTACSVESTKRVASRVSAV